MTSPVYLDDFLDQQQLMLLFLSDKLSMGRSVYGSSNSDTFYTHAVYKVARTWHENLLQIALWSVWLAAVLTGTVSWKTLHLPAVSAHEYLSPLLVATSSALMAQSNFDPVCDKP